MSCWEGNYKDRSNFYLVKNIFAFIRTKLTKNPVKIDLF